MGTMVGHVGPGLGFFAIGLWHLINHTRFYCKNRGAYTSVPWFPSSILSRYLELYIIMAGCSMSIAMELFIGPANHQPLDPSDWSIPSYHLHNFEHASISLTFFIYALFSLLLDKFTNTNKGKSSSSSSMANSMAQVLGGIAFSQQLLMFHLHSADHMGVEGQYHWLLQLVIGVSLVTTLMGIGYEHSFVVSFVRSMSIMFQGVWLFVMGIMLWTPEFIPKGCFMNMEDGHLVLRCHDDESLHRAKSLVNIEFSWYLAGVATLAVLIYLFMEMSCSSSPEYSSLVEGNPMSAFSLSSSSEEEEEEEEEEDLELQVEKSPRYVHVGRGMESVDFER